MPPRKAPATHAETDAATAAPIHTREITAETYSGREFYAARDAVRARDGLLHALRAALNSAGGKTVVITIAVK